MMIERRTLVRGLALGVLVAPRTARAQPAAKIYRVGVVLEGGPYHAGIEGLRIGLKELGSVTTAVQRATTSVPIVFCTGRDPIEAGPVKSLARPGGRLTGVQSRATDLAAKCLEVLTEIVPKLRRVMGFYNEKTSVAGGALAGYGASYQAVGRLVAKQVHRVLLGTSPADLPVERSDRFELVVNLTTARALGLTIPQSVLGRADEVIQ